MVEILNTPFPVGYYKAEGWLQSLVTHYGEKQQKLPVDVLVQPMQSLVIALYDITEIYGNFPDIVYNALGQAIDPLFSPDEYKREVYDVLHNAGVNENRPLLVEYSNALMTIRNLYQRDKKFYTDNFSDVIARTPCQGENSKYEKFTSEIQEITKTHINQVRRMIADRK